MSVDVKEIAGRLTGHDKDMIANAWQANSGRWYIDGRCKHLYGDGLCSLSGVLTAAGEQVRSHLLATEPTA